MRAGKKAWNPHTTATRGPPADRDRALPGIRSAAQTPSRGVRPAPAGRATSRATSSYRRTVRASPTALPRAFVPGRPTGSHAEWSDSPHFGLGGGAIRSTSKRPGGAIRSTSGSRLERFAPLGLEGIRRNLRPPSARWGGRWPRGMGGIRPVICGENAGFGVSQEGSEASRPGGEPPADQGRLEFLARCLHFVSEARAGVAEA